MLAWLVFDLTDIFTQVVQMSNCDGLLREGTNMSLGKPAQKVEDSEQQNAGHILVTRLWRTQNTSYNTNWHAKNLIIKLVDLLA